MLASLRSLFGKKTAPRVRKKTPARGTVKASKKTLKLPKVPVPGSVDAIEVDYSLFPKIRILERPPHHKHDEVRWSYIEGAFRGIAPYYSFLCSLKGIRESSEMQALIREIIIRHIKHFWDIPSSENHHHSCPWGGLVHSLDTACREAVVWQGGKIYSEFGVDSERTRKDILWQGFGGFMVGMFHDVAKIMDLEITSVGQRPRTFETLNGELLDFYLIHPEGVRVRWKRQRPNIKASWNMMYVWTFTPRDALYQMPQDLRDQMMYKLLSYEELRSDRESVRRWSEQDQFNNMVVQALGKWYLQAPKDFQQGPQAPFHTLDANWVACDVRVVMSELAKRLGHKQDDLAQALAQSGIMAKSQDGNRYYSKVKLHVGEATIERETCLLNVVPFNKAFDRVGPKGNAPFRLSSRAAKIHLDSKPVVTEFTEGVAPALADFVFHAPDAAGSELGAGSEKKGGKPGGGNGKKAPAKKQKKGKPVPQEPQEIDITKAMPMVEQEVEEPAPTPEGQTADLSEQAPAEQPAAESSEDAADEKEQEETSALDQHIQAAQDAEPETLFHEAAGTKITSEEALERFRVVLDRVAKKPSYIQRKKGSIMWLTTDGRLVWRHPGGANLGLDLHAQGRLNPDQVVLRSKFISHLEKLGYISGLGSGENIPRQKYDFYMTKGGEVQEAQVYLSALEIDREKVVSLCPAFTKKLKRMLSVNRSVALEAEDLAEGASDA